jgi:exopolyphosphatase / guanosine-5'-triphosphate,3'-diphosphate pyrophosphatase
MFACIDLGSNSFHLLIARWQNGRHEIVERFSEKVQLGEGLATSGHINSAAFARGLSCLEAFALALKRYPINHLWAVGTNALRIASNADEFLVQAANRGFNIDVVTGLEEAALVYAGVMSALPDDDQSRLIIDIGGGSTELIVGRGAQQLQAHSMPIGCISWRDRWFASALEDAETVTSRLKEAANASEQVFLTIADQLANTPWTEVYASSGTAKMLSAICSQRSSPGAPPSGVQLETLESLVSDIVAVTLNPRLSLRGLKNGRRELILPGWAVLMGFMKANGVSVLHFSPAALREGMLHYLVKADQANDSPLHVLRGY